MYSNDQLRSLFQGKFDLQDWNKFVLDVVKPTAYRQTPEQLDLNPDEGTGYYLGQKKTDDNYEIGLFYLRLNSSVKSRRVGLRQLVKPYVRYLVDAALVVFDDGNNWRLSFICDLQGNATAPKRYTFVFGDANNWYNTAVSRFVELQSKGVSFANLKEAFSVEALTKEFYNELFDWYQWAVSPGSGIYFPNNTETSDDDFEEAAHLSSDGDFDLYEIMKALHDIDFSGPIRPDHGRMIWDEVAMPGYGLYDRALGAAYLNGLWEAIDKNSK